MEKLNFHPLAETELVDSIEFYKEISPELGLDFQKKVKSATQTITEYPERWRERSTGYRRYNLTRFPYYLPYILRGDTIWIVAVAHGHRKPEYWENRIDDLKSS